MSDIGILNDPLSLALIALLLGSPGLALGAVAGALVWRAAPHCRCGAWSARRRRTLAAGLALLHR